MVGLSRFTPRWMLIATWYQVGYYNSHADLVILEIVFCIFVEHERYLLHIATYGHTRYNLIKITVIVPGKNKIGSGMGYDM